ncbi:MAG: hypothetical protein JXA22_05255 [Candidatus Thermoplasmatota archaeon]|nr:hypothetical protein [Candidatus Thermoplasmatota archaeon]
MRYVRKTIVLVLTLLVLFVPWTFLADDEQNTDASSGGWGKQLFVDGSGGGYLI